jgi:hypothetical protein
MLSIPRVLAFVVLLSPFTSSGQGSRQVYKRCTAEASVSAGCDVSSGDSQGVIEYATVVCSPAIKLTSATVQTRSANNPTGAHGVPISTTAAQAGGSIRLLVKAKDTIRFMLVGEGPKQAFCEFTAIVVDSK